MAEQSKKITELEKEIEYLQSHTRRMIDAKALNEKLKVTIKELQESKER
jgi:hypothetical protein